MKKIVLSILVAVAFVPGVRAALYLEEAFPYATGNLNSQPGWSGGSGSQVTAGSLNYPGLVSPTVTSNKVNLPSTASTASKSFNALPISSGNVYLSFLLKQTTLATSMSGSTVAGLDDDGTFSTSSGRVASALGIHVKQTNSTTYLVGVRKAQGASGAGGGTDIFFTGDSFVTGETVFIVAKYTFGPSAGDDTVTLWVNPATNSFGGIEPVASIAATNSGNTTDATQLQHVFVRCNSSTTSGINEIDDVRVGSTWADVTPNGSAEPPAATPQPRITQSFLAPGGLVLRGTNGVANGVYQVLSSTALTAPMINWPPIATNLFDASGNFDSTNPVSPSDARRFYRILVGGNIVLPPAESPIITTQPTNLTVLAGQNASFIGTATGTSPLAYQWFFNTTTALPNGSNPTYVITNAQAANEGNYTLRVTNSAGSVTSVIATLTVNVPPSITAQPQNQTVTVSNATAFTVIASGDAPFSYQWYFSNATIPSATNATHTISSATTNDAGNYFVTVNNPFGSATSSVATLTVNPASTNNADFSLYGFGFPATGSGQIAETDPNYRKVYTPGDLRLALANNATKVIEIMNDLNLGWNEIGATNQTGAFRANATPVMHPVLIASGVSTIDIQNKNGITIFSANGATIRHAEFNVKRSNNILIRNLKFDELWEWDEATKGDYDSKDWDFITIGDGDNCTNVWIDHCDFTRSYDGTVDLKSGANQVTVSWCRFLGDDGSANSFVRQQFNHLETNGTSETMFDFLRGNGFSIDDIVAVARSQKKGHLAGPTEFNSGNADIKLTLHHNYYKNHQDRLPRLRGGNSHVYNVYLDNTEALAAKNMRNAKVALIPGGLGSYKFDVTLNGAISTEDGAVLVEKCHLIDLTSPLRNNQVDANDPSYTGKIRAEDTIHTLNGSTFHGDTEDPGSTLIPVPAPLKPFSWNGFATLPYSYPLTPATNVANLVTNLAGRGVISWSKTNWFKTTY